MLKKFTKNIAQKMNHNTSKDDDSISMHIRLRQSCYFLVLDLDAGAAGYRISCPSWLSTMPILGFFEVQKSFSFDFSGNEKDIDGRASEKIHPFNWISRIFNRSTFQKGKYEVIHETATLNFFLPDFHFAMEIEPQELVDKFFRVVIMGFDCVEPPIKKLSAALLWISL